MAGGDLREDTEKAEKGKGRIQNEKWNMDGLGEG